MSKLTKIMLGLTIVNAVASALVLTGIINVSNFQGLYVVFPLAAIFYGMFLICRMLQNEVAGFDAEERRHREVAERNDHSQSGESLHGHGHHEPVRI
jgi:hypothetical protein